MFQCLPLMHCHRNSRTSCFRRSLHSSLACLLKTAFLPCSPSRQSTEREGNCVLKTGTSPISHLLFQPSAFEYRSPIMAPSNLKLGYIWDQRDSGMIREKPTCSRVSQEAQAKLINSSNLQPIPSRNDSPSLRPSRLCNTYLPSTCQFTDYCDRRLPPTATGHGEVCPESSPWFGRHGRPLSFFSQ